MTTGDAEGWEQEKGFWPSHWWSPPVPSLPMLFWGKMLGNASLAWSSHWRYVRAWRSQPPLAHSSGLSFGSGISHHEVPVQPLCYSSFRNHNPANSREVYFSKIRFPDLYFCPRPKTTYKKISIWVFVRVDSLNVTLKVTTWIVSLLSTDKNATASS